MLANWFVLNFENIEEGSLVIISNMLGKIITSKIVNNQKIDLNKINSGVYFIEIENHTSKKLIIQ